MKEVNLFGCTTAEKLINLEEAYKSLVNGLVGSASVQGDYVADQVYKLGDIVNSDGASYVYYNEARSQNIPVTNKEYWFLLAARGTQGYPGIPGPQGERGPQGEPGISYVLYQHFIACEAARVKIFFSIITKTTQPFTSNESLISYNQNNVAASGYVSDPASPTDTVPVVKLNFDANAGLIKVSFYKNNSLLEYSLTFNSITDIVRELK